MCTQHPYLIQEQKANLLNSSVEASAAMKRQLISRLISLAAFNAQVALGTPPMKLEGKLDQDPQNHEPKVSSALDGSALFNVAAVICDDGDYCYDGETCTATGCIPEGSVDCRNGLYCDPGESCTKTGCIPEGSVDCGDGGYCKPGRICTETGCMLKGGVDCGDGTFCKAGRVCTRTGCMAEGAVDCGNGKYCDAGTVCRKDGTCRKTGDPDDDDKGDDSSSLEPSQTPTAPASPSDVEESVPLTTSTSPSPPTSASRTPTSHSDVEESMPLTTSTSPSPPISASITPTSDPGTGNGLGFPGIPTASTTERQGQATTSDTPDAASDLQPPSLAMVFGLLVIALFLN